MWLKSLIVFALLQTVLAISDCKIVVDLEIKCPLPVSWLDATVEIWEKGNSTERKISPTYNLDPRSGVHVEGLTKLFYDMSEKNERKISTFVSTSEPTDACDNTQNSKIFLKIKANCNKENEFKAIPEVYFSDAERSDRDRYEKQVEIRAATKK